MLIKFINKNFFYFKLLIIFLSVLFILNIIFNDYNLLLDNLHAEKNFFNLIIIFFFIIISQNLVSGRFFILFKLLFNYSEKFFIWNKIFFYTSLINISFFGTGHIDRAMQVKKKGIRYRDYISSLIVVNLLSIFIYFIIFSLIYLKYYIIFFLFLFFLFYIPLKQFFFFILKKKFSIKFFNKNILIFEIILSFLIIFFSTKKNFFIFIIFTLLIFVFELAIFYIICALFLNLINIEIILTYFVITFIVNRTPFISNLPIFNDLIISLFGTLIGIELLDGITIQLVSRILTYSSLIFNSFFNFIIFHFRNRFFFKN